MNLLENRETVCIVEMINNIEEQLNILKKSVELHMISIGDASIEYLDLTKKERALREKLVGRMHVRQDGTPRRIAYHAATDDNPAEYWYTIMPDGTRKKSRDRDMLISVLYDHYTGALADNSIRAIFKAALHEKSITENPKESTLIKNRADFKRFISDELAATDIRGVDGLQLKEYTQKWVNSTHPKKSVYLSYKGILNLTFNYAVAHGLIRINPVKAINNKVYLKSCDTSRPKSEEKIFSPEEIQVLKDEVRKRMGSKKYGRYYIYGYALLFVIETGVRVAELCSLRWEDVNEECIHIHSQQLIDRKGGRLNYYYDPTTKNEKGVSEDGRDYPLTNKINMILTELKGLQEEMGINSEYIFCDRNGKWMTTDGYQKFLIRLCRSFGYKITNNHAFRMSLNSNVLLPRGFTVAERAELLGHSIETNLRYYSYAKKSHLQDAKTRLDSGSEDCEVSRDTSGTPKIVQFTKIKRAQNH